MSLLFNMLSNFVMALLPRSKRFLISWSQSLSKVILERRQWNLTLFPLFLHLFTMKWWDWMPWSVFFDCWILSHLFLSPASRSSLVPLHFLPLKWYNLLSEVVDISPCNLNSSLWVMQPSISYDVLGIWVKYTGWQYTALMYSFPNLEPTCHSNVPCTALLLLLDLHADFSGGS